MSLLLDTQAFLWFVWADPQLSPNAAAAISDPKNAKWVSVASAWEIAIKAGIGKLRLGEPARSFVGREVAQNRFALLPISLEHATAVENLPSHHRDPFDRLLAAQAAAEGMTIVSADVAFDPYGVARIW